MPSELWMRTISDVTPKANLSLACSDRLMKAAANDQTAELIDSTTKPVVATVSAAELLWSAAEGGLEDRQSRAHKKTAVISDIGHSAS